MVTSVDVDLRITTISLAIFHHTLDHLYEFWMLVFLCYYNLDEVILYRNCTDPEFTTAESWINADCRSATIYVLNCRLGYTCSNLIFQEHIPQSITISEVVFSFERRELLRVLDMFFRVDLAKPNSVR